MPPRRALRRRDSAAGALRAARRRRAVRARARARVGRSPSWCRPCSGKDAVALYDFTLLSRPRVDGPANFLLHLLDPLQFVLWGVALVAVALARERPRVALAVAAVMALAPLTAETLKPLLAHPHVSRRRRPHRRRLVAERPLDRRARAGALARCSSRRARLRPLVASIGARVRAGRRLLAADPRLAHAERRARRLPGGEAVDGARRRRAARRRASLAAAAPAP